MLREKAGLPPNMPLALYEEEFTSSLNEISDHKKTLSEAIGDLSDGDIIVFHRNDQVPEISITNYYNDLLLKAEVLFCDKNNPNDAGFTLELSLKMNYTQMAHAVAMRLGTDPNLIQFFKNQRYSLLNNCRGKE